MLRRLVLMLVMAALVAIPLGTYHADGQAPSVGIHAVDPPAGNTIGIGENMTVTLAEIERRAGLTVVTAEINGVDVAESFVDVGDGTYTLSYMVSEDHDTIHDSRDMPIDIKLRDDAGRQTFSLLYISSGSAPGTYPGRPATPTLTSPCPVVFGPSQTLAGYTDPGTSVTVLLGGQTYDADTGDWSWSHTAELAPGRNTITATALDTLGNSSSGTFEITYETSPRAPDTADYDDMPDYTIYYGCAVQHPADTDSLPEFDLMFPDPVNRADLYGAITYATIYKIGAVPHEQVHVQNVTIGRPSTISLDGEAFGPGQYEIYYFADTADGTLLMGFHDVAYYTTAPPPPVIASPADGERFSPLTNTTQAVSGTAAAGTAVDVTVTEASTGAERVYSLPVDVLSWGTTVTLYEGENRISAVAAYGDLRSEPAGITVHLVEGAVVQPVTTPVITHPADGARFAPDEQNQEIAGTHAGDTVRLRVAHIVNGAEADAATYSEGRDNSTHWSRDVALYEGENRLTAVAVRGTAESAPSEPVTVFVSRPDPVCATDVTSHLAFGTLTDGQTSREETMTFTNTGDRASTHKLHGTHWVDPEQARGTIMDVSQTRHHGTAGTAYADKTALTGAMESVLSGLAPGDSGDVYLQVLIDLSGQVYAGSLQQKIIVGSSCG